MIGFGIGALIVLWAFLRQHSTAAQ